MVIKIGLTASNKEAPNPKSCRKTKRLDGRKCRQQEGSKARGSKCRLEGSRLEGSRLEGSEIRNTLYLFSGPFVFYT